MAPRALDAAAPPVPRRDLTGEDVTLAQRHASRHLRRRETTSPTARTWRRPRWTASISRKTSAGRHALATHSDRALATACPRAYRMLAHAPFDADGARHRVRRHRRRSGGLSRAAACLRILRLARRRRCNADARRACARANLETSFTVCARERPRGARARLDAPILAHRWVSRRRAAPLCRVRCHASYNAALAGDGLQGRGARASGRRRCRPRARVPASR